MEAVKFITTLQKLCEGKGCDDCPLHDIDICDVRCVEDPEEMVRIVEEWEKEQDRQKQEKEQHKTEQERQKPEHPEESSDLHAIIDEIEDRIYKLADRIAALEENENMPRYVDLDKLPLVNIDVDTVNRTAYVDIREVQQALRQAEAQTGEVAPVVHGHWMSWEEMFPEQTPRKKNNLGVFCSECNSHNDTRRNYCPECGCRMDGKM